MKKTLTFFLFACAVLISLKAQPPVSTDTVVIARETFGDVQFDYDTSGTVIGTDTIMPPMDTPGFPTQWDYDAILSYDTFTSTNGTVVSTSSDSSMRVNAYGDDGIGGQDWDNASGSEMLFLATAPDSLFGSWDSIAYTGIDISRYENLSFSFGHIYSPGFKQSDALGLSIQARVDGGAWVELDTASIDGAALTDAAWTYVTLSLPEDMVGHWLDIQMGAININDQEHYLDDLTVSGTIKYDSINLTRETFGDVQFDTGTNPTVTATDTIMPPTDTPGYATQWDYDAILSFGTFTSTNGTVISTSSDSSMRINGYGDNGIDHQNWDNASGSEMVFLTTRPGAYFGSWDSIAYSGIDITGCEKMFFSFGHIYRPGFRQSDAIGLSIQARVDSGAWVELDTASIVGTALTDTAWVFVTLPIPEDMVGHWLDIQIGAINIDNHQHWLDDLTLTGYKAGVVTVDNIAVTGEGGATTIDTEGGTLQMMAVVEPSNADDPTYSWKVVNGSGIANISEGGLLTAECNGTVTVVARANDNGTKGELEIILSNQSYLVTSISLSPSGAISVVEGNTQQFTADVMPGCANDVSVTWTVEIPAINPGYATIDQNGLLTADSAGSVSVVATANDGSGERGVRTVTISPFTSVKDIHQSGVQLSPNPVTNVINLENTSSVVLVEIYGINGSVIKKVTNNSNNTLSINASDLNSGIYFIKLHERDGSIFVSKFIKE